MNPRGVVWGIGLGSTLSSIPTGLSARQWAETCKADKVCVQAECPLLLELSLFPSVEVSLLPLPLDGMLVPCRVTTQH